MYATQCNRMKPRHETVHTGLPRAKTSLCQKFQKECVSVSSKCLCLTKRPARSSSTKILAGAICWGDFFSAAALNSHDDQADFEQGKNFKFPSHLPPRRQLRRAGPPSHLPQPGCRRILTGRERAAAGGSAATSWQLGKDRDTQIALARPASVLYDCTHTRHSARDSPFKLTTGPAGWLNPSPGPDRRLCRVAPPSHGCGAVTRWRDSANPGRRLSSSSSSPPRRGHLARQHIRPDARRMPLGQRCCKLSRLAARAQAAVVRLGKPGPATADPALPHPGATRPAPASRPETARPGPATYIHT